MKEYAKNTNLQYQEVPIEVMSFMLKAAGNYSHHRYGGRTRSWMIPFVVKNIFNYIIAYKIKQFYF